MQDCLIFALIFLVVSVIGQSRITNGRPALESEFPYQAYIYDYDTYCGGSIIHKRWVLTAAHCRYKNRAILSVFVGTIKNLGIGGTRYEVERIINHERSVIKKNFVIHDIALVRVQTDIVFNYKVRPVKLPLNNLIKYQNSLATVCGWGKLRPSNPNTYLPRELQCITVRVVEQEKCRRYWPNLSDQQICTTVSAGKSTCQGDSGDPLVIGLRQIGIASYNDGECGRIKPTVHTRVSSYLPWIKYQMNLYFDELV